MSDDIRSAVVDFIESTFKVSLEKEKISDEQSLVETGVLDSAAIIELITWLEVNFDIMIPTEDITLDKLGDISAICSYVAYRRAV